MDIDAQLLDRYVRTRDAEAFTQLVRRHAGMVFAVARRITLNHHDAEEITQGCFLDLARKAGGIQGSLAGWLHSAAAYRAIDLNRATGRRRRHERIAAQPEVQADEGWSEIAPLVDGALAELPEELRLPVVIYYLEGRSQAEVAEELGVTQATVSRRLEAGVAALREKLKAAGVMAPSMALPVLLAQHAIVAVPKTLVATLGKLAISGVVPAASGASGAISGAASVATKGAMPLVAKIAAAVVIASAISTTGYLALRARTQTVVAVAQAGGNLAHYEGWIHVVQKNTGGNLRENEEVFFNTMTHQMGTIRDNDRKQNIEWFDPKTTVVQRYDGSDNTITMRDLPDEPAHWNNSPDELWTLVHTVAGASISQTRDGDLDRYQFHGTTNNNRNCLYTIWIKHATKLMQNFQAQMESNDQVLMETEFHYGDREIKDIYDLGAPRGAAIVDHRIAGELKEVLTQVRVQTVQGLGDGVGIVSQSFTRNNSSNTRGPVPFEVTLQAQQGESELSMCFMKDIKRGWGNPKAKLPKVWTAGNVDNILDFLGQLHTSNLSVTNGHTLWQSEQNNDGTVSPKSAPVNSQIHALSSEFWPNLPDPGRIEDPHSNTRIELVRQPENPALVGLHITHLYNQFVDGKSSFGPSIFLDQTYWLDPSRNEIPVEIDDQHYDTKGERTSSTKTQFVDYAQLPDGRWYPTEWLWIYTFYTSGKSRDQQPIDNRFIFAPGKMLDASWFRDSTSRFAAEDANGDSLRKQTATGVAGMPHAVAAIATKMARSAWLWWPWALAAIVFGAAGVLLIRQRLNQAPAPPLRGHQGPRRR